MNELLEKSTGGNLASDGRANEVAEDVIKNPSLLPKLAEGLGESDDVVRARTAHAFERISRANPELLHRLTSQFTKLASTEKVPMVEWHLAMIFGNVRFPVRDAYRVLAALFHLLEDKSIFVRNGRWLVLFSGVEESEVREERLQLGSRLSKMTRASQLEQESQRRYVFCMTKQNRFLPAGSKQETLRG